MITVYIPPSFVAERKYIVDTLLRHYLGIEVEIVDRPGQIHFELVWENKRILIHDAFFGQTFVGDTYLHANRVPEKCFTTNSPGLDNIVLLFGKDHVSFSNDQVECSVDLFAGAFFMLTRWEETLGNDEDMHGRFPAADSLVVKSGFILRPVVDEYVALLRNWLLQLGYPVPGSKAQFTVIPSCDVDMPFYWLRSPRWKLWANEWRKHRSWDHLRNVKKKIKAVHTEEEMDPYDTFDEMMDLAEGANHRIQFNFLAGGLTKYEGHYAVQDERIKRMMQRMIQRGHTIGLHPSYNSSVDIQLIREEKKNLESQVNQLVISSRQHYLKFSIPRTWRLLSEAGIREDASMGYAAEPGFRCGTCHTFPVFDIHQRIVLPILERPLLIMDASLRYYKQLDPESAIALCGTILQEVRKHGGRFEFLWHNSNLSEMEGWLPWKGVFDFLMKQR